MEYTEYTSVKRYGQDFDLMRLVTTIDALCALGPKRDPARVTLLVAPVLGSHLTAEERRFSTLFMIEHALRSGVALDDDDIGRITARMLDQYGAAAILLGALASQFSDAFSKSGVDDALAAIDTMMSADIHIRACLSGTLIDKLSKLSSTRD